MTPDHARDVAYRDAARVVGLYGDPTVSWSIVLRARLRRPIEAETLRPRLATLVAQHPHLGPLPSLLIVPPGGMDDAVAEAANRPYVAGEPLVRGILGERGAVLAVAVHHGAADGLGMLGMAGHLLGVELRSSARGVSATAAATGFLRGSLNRLAEAAVRPPQRLAAVRRTTEGPTSGDWLVAIDVHGAMSTAVLVAAVREALESWNRSEPPRRRSRPVSMAIGASRRPKGVIPSPDRQTAYLRLTEVPHPLSVADARRILGRTRPEPDFPTTTGMGVGPLVTRALASRLGSSVLLSNLGEVRGSPDVLSLAFFPVPGGPSAVGIGLASVGSRSTLTVRAARRDFSSVAAHELAGVVAAALDAAATGQATATGQ